MSGRRRVSAAGAVIVSWAAAVARLSGPLLSLDILFIALFPSIKSSMALPQPDALSQPDALRAPDAPVRPRFCRRLKSVAVVPLLLGVVAAASLSLSLSAHGAAPVATIPRVLPAADEGGQRTGAAEEGEAA